MKAHLLNNTKIAATVVVVTLALSPFSTVNAQNRRSQSNSPSANHKSNKEQVQPTKREKEPKRDVRYEKVEKSNKPQMAKHRENLDKSEKQRTHDAPKYADRRPNRERDEYRRDEHRDRNDHYSRDYNHRDNRHFERAVYRTAGHIIAAHVIDNHHPRIVYRRMPRKAFLVTFDDQMFYYYKGRFFLNSPRGYYLVDPPTCIHRLPNGTVQFFADGISMYRYRDILFIETPHGFRIHI